MIKVQALLTVVLLLTIPTLSYSAENIIKKTLDNNPGFSQVEKDVDACEVGKTYYEVCSSYNGGYDNTDYSNSWGNGDWYDDTFDSGGDSCPYGEKKASLGWFSKEHNGYIRLEDIKECMRGKGYVRDSGKWVENKRGFINFKGQWVSPEKYIKLHTGVKNKSLSASTIPSWETRIYPRSKCNFKYLPNKDKDYRCDENGEYYQGSGKYIKNAFYPSVIIRNLSRANFSIEDISKHLTNSGVAIKTTSKSIEPVKSKAFVNKTTPKPPVKVLKEIGRGEISYISELREIKDLLDSGVISQDEFQTMKKKVIDRL